MNGRAIRPVDLKSGRPGRTLLIADQKAFRTALYGVRGQAPRKDNAILPKGAKQGFRITSEVAGGGGGLRRLEVCMLGR